MLVLNTEPFDMISTKELEQALQRTERTIRRMIATKGFPSPVVPGRWRRADVIAWMDSRAFPAILRHMIEPTP